MWHCGRCQGGVRTAPGRDGRRVPERAREEEDRKEVRKAGIGAPAVAFLLPSVRCVPRASITAVAEYRSAGAASCHSPRGDLVPTSTRPRQRLTALPGALSCPGRAAASILPRRGKRPREGAGSGHGKAGCRETGVAPRGAAAVVSGASGHELCEIGAWMGRRSATGALMLPRLRGSARPNGRPPPTRRCLTRKG
jgi:hypothetical protein